MNDELHDLHCKETPDPMTVFSCMSFVPMAE